MRREAERKNTHLAPVNIYKKAGEGKAPTVPGVGVPYEESLNPEVRVDASRLSAEVCTEKIFSTLEKGFHLKFKKL